jgi:hypothetical protein
MSGDVPANADLIGAQLNFLMLPKLWNHRRRVTLQPRDGTPVREELISPGVR